MKLYCPWSKAEVESLQLYQQSDEAYLCKDCFLQGVMRALFATQYGLICLKCKFAQNWIDTEEIYNGKTSD